MKSEYPITYKQCTIKSHFNTIKCYNDKRMLSLLCKRFLPISLSFFSIFSLIVQGREPSLSSWEDSNFSGIFLTKFLIFIFYFSLGNTPLPWQCLSWSRFISLLLILQSSAWVDRVITLLVLLILLIILSLLSQNCNSGLICLCHQL